MKKILTGGLSLLVLLAIAKVLLAQPMQETAPNVTTPEVMGGNAEMMNADVVMNDEVGNMMMNEENAMEMHQEGGY